MITNRFDRAVSALVQAYFNDTLRAGNCLACAVGQICAAGMGATIGKSPEIYGGLWADKPIQKWGNVFTTTKGSPQCINYEQYHGIAAEVIDSTDYSLEELARVEWAFEQNTVHHWTDYSLLDEQQISDDQYNGLMAVVDILCEIEGIADSSEYKAMFAKPEMV